MLNVMKVLTQKNIMSMFLVVILIKLFVLIINSRSIVVYRDENAAYKFIKAILEEHKYCKKIMKNEFNKNLIMTEEEEYLFQQSNSCWICKKIIDNEDEKVRDDCQTTGKFRGSAHWDCNINFQLTKKNACNIS